MIIHEGKQRKLEKEGRKEEIHDVKVKESNRIVVLQKNQRKMEKRRKKNEENYNIEG